MTTTPETRTARDEGGTTVTAASPSPTTSTAAKPDNKKKTRSGRKPGSTKASESEKAPENKNTSESEKVPEQDKKPAAVKGPRHAAPEPALRITGLRKDYGDVKAVRGLDLSIAPGEVVALLGPNGAGKSTTVDMILGLAKPTAGSITVFGKAPYVAVREGMASAVLQEGSLIDDLSVRETLGMISSLYKDPLPMDEVLRRANIEDIVDRRGTKLSGGQRQRARFACALVGNPQLLILDEPTSAMDVGSRRKFWESMRKFTDTGRTVVFATHYLDEAEEFADRVVLMRAGQIAADGTVAEIRALTAGRLLRAAVPGATADELKKLPGVTAASIRLGQAELHCDDSDAAVRALVTRYADAHDIEISATGLEEAFLTLTSDDDASQDDTRNTEDEAA
ncbi:ABC transporter ATP-binding protein [Streptomyces sp. HUAS TT20]|uniref:ABC transporter ATP-binding protein n=1 Tax=Streptomyces sp. HUAS TT20 TaxID=3447509 RepID=UPI0021DAF561|nr:ABC transporter ATP-binding protein [Streptomyces sp. HUAS 15-9]UXY30536.1 ABC transporter ATP-binding protein [Streptomyces sp. HUAS 15-9]